MGAIAFCVAVALGSLGRRFEFYRPDSKKPSHTIEVSRPDFLLDVVSYCERVALGVARVMYFDVFSAHFKSKNYLKKISFYVITSPNALDIVTQRYPKQQSH